MNKTPIEILELFDEKYNRLQSSTLISFMTNPGWKFSFDFKNNALSSDAVFPDWKYIESYILNLRFFIQDKESISLCNLSKFYKTHSRDNEAIKKISELRNILNSELDKAWPYRFNKQELTFRDIFNGFIYSKIAHSNIEKHKIFSDLVKHSFGYYLAFDYFLRCIDFVHNILSMIYHLNRTTFANEYTK